MREDETAPEDHRQRALHFPAGAAVEVPVAGLMLVGQLAWYGRGCAARIAVGTPGAGQTER